MINRKVFNFQVNPSSFLIAGNDEHGLTPTPTAGKRSPIMPYVNRPFYENEFNRATKNFFLTACRRCGMRTLDVKPETSDVSLATRASRVNNAGATLLVTFAYNAFGDGISFNTGNGFEVIYSTYNRYPERSRVLAQNIADSLAGGTPQSNRGVKTGAFYLLYAVNCPSNIVEAGFMTNLREAKLMLDPDFQQEVGEETCQGVCKFLGVPYIPPSRRNLTTIRRGSSGNLVTYAQQKLYSKLYADVGTIDGVFGPKTQNAVRQFQSDNGLVVDGIIGPRTWAILSETGGGRT